MRKGGVGVVLGAGLVLASSAVASPSTHLPPAHWAVKAAEQLEEMGLASDYLPAQRAVPISEVRRVFREAAAKAPPSLRPTIDGWVRQLDDEFGRTASGLGVNARGWFERASERLITPPPPVEPPPAEIPRNPPAHPWALAASASAAALIAAGSVELGLDRGGVDVRTWEVEAELGPWSLSVGKRPVAYAPGTGVVLSGSIPIPIVELSTARAVRLPFLEVLGDFSFEAFISADLDEERHPYGARLMGMAAYWKPHPRLALGVQRAAMFEPDGMSASQILSMVSLLKNGRENNVLSACARYRLPTEAWLPVTVYGEWATDDGDLAYFYVPGLRAGAVIPSLPGLPMVSVGFEYTFIGSIAVRRFSWYAHFVQRGGWVSQDVPLGHPLGGNGREERVYATIPMFGAALTLDVAAFRRTRFFDNLYSPMREGDSLGGSLALRWQPFSRLELSLAGEREAGEHWSDASASGRLGLIF